MKGKEILTQITSIGSSQKFIIQIINYFIYFVFYETEYPILFF